MKSKKKAVLIAAGFAVLLLAGLGTGLLLFGGEDKGEAPKKAVSMKADPEKSEAEYKKLRANTAPKADDPSQNNVNFKELKAMNPDIYAWIRIPGTNVDYPVLQNASKPDDYYLNTTADKKQGLPGSIYTEKYNMTNFQDPVTVMYGHTLKAGTMFSELNKYTDKAFFDANPYIYIYLPGQTLKYQIFAAVSFDDRYILGSYGFSDPDDFNKYVNELKACMNGNVNNDIAVTGNSKIITLSTCIDEFPNQRWLVNAVRLDQ